MSEFLINLERYRSLEQNLPELIQADNEEYMEFLNYGAVLHCHLVYDRREQYFKSHPIVSPFRHLSDGKETSFYGVRSIIQANFFA